MERGNSKHGPVRDEELAHETEGMVRGAAQRARTEDWRQPEPVDDSIPPVTRGAPDPAVEDRAELARIMTRDWFPADRGDVLRRLADADAAPGLIDRVAGLPERERFGSVHDVLEALGISSPETRSAGLPLWPVRLVAGQLTARKPATPAGTAARPARILPGSSGPGIIAGLVSGSGSAGFGQEIKERADSVAVLSAMPEQAVTVDGVTGAPSDTGSGDITFGFQVGDDGLDRALGEVGGGGDVPDTGSGVAGYLHQDMAVPGQERPVSAAGTVGVAHAT
jgi:hypothetical protein